MGRRAAAVVLAAMVVLGVAPAAGAATPVQLELPQSAAFAVLGVGCGGIYEQTLATGFTATGQPAADVFLLAHCGGGGRGGGGGRYTTYTAWASVTWGFDGTVRTYARLAAPPSGLSPILSVTDSQDDRVYNQLRADGVPPKTCTVADIAYCHYTANLAVPPLPAPTGVTVAQVGDTLVVRWAAPPRATLSDSVLAVPTGAGATLVAAATGTATSATIASVAPSTTYSIVVKSTDAAGASPASTRVSVRTAPATVAPSAPTRIGVSWSGDGSALSASWVASVPGNSPVDDYQVAIAESDPGGPPTAIDARTATSLTTAAFDNSLDWSVTVRAHNGAGWGHWSAPVVLPAY